MNANASADLDAFRRPVTGRQVELRPRRHELLRAQTAERRRRQKENLRGHAGLREPRWKGTLFLGRRDSEKILRPPLCLCVSVVNTSVPRTTKRRLSREAALGASTLVGIHHRDTEAQRGTEKLFLLTLLSAPPRLPLPVSR